MRYLAETWQLPLSGQIFTHFLQCTKFMSPRDDDPIDQVPKMTPDYDQIASYQRNKAKSSLVSSLGEVPDTAATGSAPLGKTLLVAGVCLILAIAAWAGYLHWKLQATEQSISNYQLRVADLEQRLMVTDESVNESGVATQVKIRELDSEIRKLWDNVWKKSKQQFAEQDTQLNQHAKSIKSNEQLISNIRQQLSRNEVVMTGLSDQLKNIQKIQSQVMANKQVLLKLEQSMEATADKANSVNANIVKLDKRVKSTEEWVESINGFRRQVNRDMDTLKQNVGQLQSSGAP